MENKPVVLGYSHEGGSLVISDGRVSHFAWSNLALNKEENALRLFASLEEDIPPLLTSLGLTDFERRNLEEFTWLHWRNIRIRYVPSKLFSLKRYGCFAFFANASSYARVPLSFTTGHAKADWAKGVGEAVYSILSQLGLNVTSLVNPAKVYEKNELTRLFTAWSDSEPNSLRQNVVHKIGEDTFGHRWEKLVGVKSIE